MHIAPTATGRWLKIEGNMLRAISQFIADALNILAQPFWILAARFQHEDYFDKRLGIFVRIGDALEDIADRFDVRLKETLSQAWQDYKSSRELNE